MLLFAIIEKIWILLVSHVRHWIPVDFRGDIWWFSHRLQSIRLVFFFSPWTVWLCPTPIASRCARRICGNYRRHSGKIIRFELKIAIGRSVSTGLGARVFHSPLPPFVTAERAPLARNDVLCGQTHKSCKLHPDDAVHFKQRLRKTTGAP